MYVQHYINVRGPKSSGHKGCKVSQKSLPKNFIIQSGRKENRTNTGKNKQEKAGLQSHDTIHHYQSAYQI